LFSFRSPTFLCLVCPFEKTTNSVLAYGNAPSLRSSVFFSVPTKCAMLFFSFTPSTLLRRRPVLVFVRFFFFPCLCRILMPTLLFFFISLCPSLGNCDLFFSVMAAKEFSEAVVLSVVVHRNKDFSFSFSNPLSLLTALLLLLPFNGWCFFPKFKRVLAVFSLSFLLLEPCDFYAFFPPSPVPLVSPSRQPFLLS